VDELAGNRNQRDGQCRPPSLLAQVAGNGSCSTGEGLNASSCTSPASLVVGALEPSTKMSGLILMYQTPARLKQKHSIARERHQL
jgi:hypothetical protein